ncbi:MAG: hypothetical protein ACK47B_10965 [Armatimonadota bacterium]
MDGDHKPDVAGTLLAGAAAAVFTGCAVPLAYEAYALHQGKKPITEFVREEARERPRLTLVSGTIIGLVLGHFYWH